MAAIAGSARAEGAPLSDLTLWVNAYIPGTIRGEQNGASGEYTRRLTKPPLAGESVIPHPFESLEFLPWTQRTYATDQREASPLLDASARLHVEVALHADSATRTVTIVRQLVSSSGTREFDRATEKQECAAVAATDRVRITSEPLRDQLGLRLRIRGAVNDPCSPTSRLFGDVDLALTIDVNMGIRQITCGGFVDRFPAFEAYWVEGQVADRGSTVGQPLMLCPLLPGTTPLDLPGGATRRVDETTSLVAAPPPGRAFALGERSPDAPEAAVVSAATLKIVRGTAPFLRLRENRNPLIVFKDEDPGTDLPRPDHMMTYALSQRLNLLAALVAREWPGVRLRVTEAWDEQGEHAPQSTHYEGRAVDLTSSDKDDAKLGRLARLAADAGFDFVWYEDAEHVHASMKRYDD